MQNSQKIEEMENEPEQAQSMNSSFEKIEENVQADQVLLSQEDQVFSQDPSYKQSSYRLPRQREQPKRRQELILHSHSKDINEKIGSQQSGKHLLNINEVSSAMDGNIEPETELRKPRIRIQKINFGEFSDSDDCTGDSNSPVAGQQQPQSNRQSTLQKKGNKAVTLIFQRRNEDSAEPEKRTIEEELDGSQQNIQTGNLVISICNTDEHYPPLFNQRYLEDNISLIQKKQCHIRQKRRMLQLETINSISIDKDNKLYNLLDEHVIKEQNQGNLQVQNGIVEYEQSLRPQPVSKQKVKCNCKKTKCLKLYCDCFNQGEFCSEDCNCTECLNTLTHKEERDQVMNALKERNPDAFKPKIQTKEDDEEVLIHNKGCNCKKSGCEKKYCECYNTGVKCSIQCKCEGCRNRDPQSLVKGNGMNGGSNNNLFNAHASTSYSNPLHQANINGMNSLKLVQQSYQHELESGEYIHENSNHHNMLSNGSNNPLLLMHHHHHQALNNQIANHGLQRNSQEDSGPSIFLSQSNQQIPISNKAFNMNDYNADIQSKFKSSKNEGSQNFSKKSGGNNFSSFNSFLESSKIEERNKNKMKNMYSTNLLDPDGIYSQPEDYPSTYGQIAEIGSLGILGQTMKIKSEVDGNSFYGGAEEKIVQSKKSNSTIAAAAATAAATTQNKNDETVLSLKNGQFKTIVKTE